MTPKQRYLFDLSGYLHLKNVLADDELREAQAAIDRLLATPPDPLPSGIQRGGEGFSNGFSFDKSLEALTWHPATQPIIKELTDGKPRFNRGSLVINTCENRRITYMHCAREDCGWQTRRYAVKDGHIHCNDFICFFYFTDVHPGDGGLVVLPGSHKSNFERPDGIFFQDLQDADHPLHPALVNVLPSAGDVVILSELTTHDVLQWKPTDRDRRFLILHYRPQYEGRASLPQKIIERLSPETQELVASASYGHTKETVNQDVITLTT